jgi:hypothetical protein
MLEERLLQRKDENEWLIHRGYPLKACLKGN